MKNKQENKIKIIPLGGLGGIGKNITLFEYKESMIIIDCGIMFPSYETPGIDFIIPDFSYILKNKQKLKAIIITHGHEDHIGAIPFLLQKINVPIYATKLTIGLIQSRLTERPPKDEPVFREVRPRDNVTIGAFSLEFIRVTHSIVDSIAIALKTDIGVIIYTGDFKIDFSPVDGDVTDIQRFADYGEKGVLLLMSDSTNAERPGFTQSESILDNRLIDIFSSSKGRIIIVTFASNISRIQQVLDVAQRFNRKVVLSGYSLLKNVEIANSLGYLKVKEDQIIDIEDNRKINTKKYVIIGTGSQGEPMSAIYRMANGTHRHFAIEKTDTVVITASVIPGNERLVTNIINMLMKLGAEVYYDRDAEIHVSGHGSAKELKLMISITKPNFFIPIHGEYKHLKAHSKIAESLKINPSRILIASNGDVLELTKKTLKKINSIEMAQIYVDGDEIGNVDSNLIKDRQVMSTDGIIFVTLIISKGMPINPPVVISKGFIEYENSKLLEILKKEIENKSRKMLSENLSLKEIIIELKKDVKKYVFKKSRRNALIEIQIIDI